MTQKAKRLYLTEAQRRMLAEVYRDGERRYNGRAGRTVRSLAALDLIRYDYDVRLQNKGDSSELYIVRPNDELDLAGAGERGLGYPW